MTDLYFVTAQTKADPVLFCGGGKNIAWILAQNLSAQADVYYGFAISHMLCSGSISRPSPSMVHAYRWKVNLVPVLYV